MRSCGVPCLHLVTFLHPGPLYAPPTNPFLSPTSPPSVPAASSEGFNPMKTFQKELGIQSNKLQPDIKERVERAIAALGYRVTVGDVAARAGVSIAQADEALKALAYDSLGNLEVRFVPAQASRFCISCMTVCAGTLPDLCSVCVVHSACLGDSPLLKEGKCRVGRSPCCILCCLCS